MRASRLLGIPVSNGRVEALIGHILSHPGIVLTPNVDHLVLVHESPALREAYLDAEHHVLDSRVVFLLSRLFGPAFESYVPGVELCERLLARSRQTERRRVFLFGGETAELCERAKKFAHDRWPGIQIVGTLSPPFGYEKDPAQIRRYVDEVLASDPDFVVIGVSFPKQLDFARALRQASARPRTYLCVGATLNFWAGYERRAPAWMNRFGVEWAYRLFQNPRRMIGRYLGRDLRFFPYYFVDRIKARFGSRNA